MPSHDQTHQPRPQVLLLDVNETLSDLRPLGDVFADLGLERSAADLWFAQVLREGFALAAVGGEAAFADIGRALAAVQLRAADLDPAGADRVIEAFTGLDVHPDVRTGLPALRAAGLRLVTLSNGSASVARSLLERAGLIDQVELVLSVEDAGAWKPAARAYDHGLRRAGVDAASVGLVAVHPWDVHGAMAAGLQGFLLTRDRVAPAPYLDEPTLVVRDLDELAARLGDQG